MRKKALFQDRSALTTGLLCVAVAVIGFLAFAGLGVKYIGIAAGLLMIWLLATRDLAPMRSAGVYLLFGYVVFSGLTIVWAIAGKFHLREYTKIFIAGAFFIYIILKEKFDSAFVRRILAAIAGSAAICALLSVEGATFGLTKALLQSIPTTSNLVVGFSGIRLSGLYGNSNAEASFYAFGILAALGLLCGAKTKKERIWDSMFLAFNALAFLLVFSMGAMACFALSVVCYLIFAGERRTVVLPRMLAGALPAAVCWVLSMRLFNREGFLGLLPFFLLFLCGAAAAFLELRFAGRFAALLHAHHKLTVAALAGVLALIAVYAAAGFALTGPHTFGDGISRSIYPTPGEHVLTVDADDGVTVSISSKSYMQAAMLTQTTLYSGPADEIRFAVPEDSVICYVSFAGEPGLTVREARLDGAKRVALDYKLFPEAVAERIQGLRYGDSSVQRAVFREDALKLWREKPVAGNGVGAYEAAESRIQSFYYETKYVHQHYLQILLEDGVIGFVMWVGALLGMAVLLWKRRKDGEEWEYGWAYGALAAMFVMTAAIQFWDVSLSFSTFLIYVYAAFALIFRCCAAPKQEPAETSETARKKSAAQNRARESELRVALCILPALIVMTLGGNLIAKGLMKQQVADVEQFFGNLEVAEKVDIYEQNDARLSYLVALMDYQATSHIPQANQYAEKLMHLDSDSTPYYVTAYYLNTAQHAKAIESAMKNADYTPGKPNNWNDEIYLLSQAFMQDPETPLLTRPDVFVPQLMAYYERFVSYNETALQPVQLNAESAAFFEKLLAVNDCGGDVEKIQAVLFG